MTYFFFHSHLAARSIVLRINAFLYLSPPYLYKSICWIPCASNPNMSLLAQATCPCCCGTPRGDRYMVHAWWFRDLASDQKKHQIDLVNIRNVTILSICSCKFFPFHVEHFFIVKMLTKQQKHQLIFSHSYIFAFSSSQ